MPAVERADFARSADALPCGDRVMAQDENVVISEPPRPPPDAPDEPTVVDAAGRKNDDTVSSDTAVTAARSSGVTTASPLILQGEELARAIALLRLVVLAGLAGLVAVWLQPRPSPGRALATISTVITVLVSLGLLVELRDVNKLDRRKLLVQGLSCVVTILAMTYYVGVFSPTIIAMYIGIYFFGLSDSVASGWTIYATGAFGYLVLNVLAMLGVIATDQAVFQLVDPQPAAMFAVLFVCQVLFAATFWMARRSRAATLAAFERLERAMRQIKKRDALLDEAMADLERERGAKLGRFTDQQVGEYAVGEVIGRGAMGEVYKAWHEQSGRAVAVKFLNPALVGESASVERFLREAEVAAKLDSRHVVRILDSGIADGATPYLVMELLIGTDLAQQLREKKRLGMSATLALVQEVAQALAAADDANVVHRDLKPQNLFHAEQGGERLWKVLDFGVSKMIDDASNLTMGAAVGTPSYMSPEQARGEDVDHRADVFALGVIAYRVLTGRPAFTAPDSVTTLYNVAHVQPVRPSDLVRTGIDVERVLALALAKDKKRRFSSALMFATALREAARQRLDERLRRDADELLDKQPWGQDVLVKVA